MKSCDVCGQFLCICAPVSPRPMVRETFVHQAWGMTQDEFGLDVFETIKSVGGILACDVQIRNNPHDPLKRMDAMSARLNLLLLLKQQRDTLSVPHTLELVSRYPWVAHV